MANAKEIQRPNEKYSGYNEDHQCHVYDLFFEAEKGKEKTGRYRTIFLYAAVRNCDESYDMFRIWTASYFDQREEKKPEDRKIGYIVVTADKGLAGAYNHNVLKHGRRDVEKDRNSNKLFVLGELGRQYFAKRADVELDKQFPVYRTESDPAPCQNDHRMRSDRTVYGTESWTKFI